MLCVPVAEVFSGCKWEIVSLDVCEPGGVSILFISPSLSVMGKSPLLILIAYERSGDIFCMAILCFGFDGLRCFWLFVVNPP